MSLSVVVCEGQRDRVLIGRILMGRWGWREASPDQHAREYAGQPFQGSAGPRALLTRQLQRLVIMERSKGDPQRKALDGLRAHVLASAIGSSWDRLLLVLDADGLGHNMGEVDCTQTVRQHVHSLFDMFDAPSDPLDEWVEAVLPVTGTDPPDVRRVRLRVHVLPGLGEPGCLETALLDGIAVQSHAQLIARLRTTMHDIKEIKDEYLKGASDVEKATAGCVLSVLHPDLRYTDLGRRYREINGPTIDRLAERLPSLGDL